MSKWMVSCSAVALMAALLAGAAPVAVAQTMQDNPNAEQAGAPQIPVVPNYGVRGLHGQPAAYPAMTYHESVGPIEQGPPVLGPLFTGAAYSIAPESGSGTIWTRVTFNNDGSITVANRLNPDDGATFGPRDVTNFNWRDDVGLNNYFKVEIFFDESARTVLVEIDDIVLMLEDPATGDPVPQPFVTGATATTVLNLMGYESNNGLLDTAAFVDDVLIDVGGTTVIDNGLEVADGVGKGPLDGQPAGPLDMMGMPTTEWNVEGGAPRSFISGINPRMGAQSIHFQRDNGGAFTFTGVTADVDQDLTPGGGDTMITTWMAIGNGSTGTADDLNAPSVACRQIGSVPDPDVPAETCCEFEWTFANTSQAPNAIGIAGGFIAVEAGNGGPCSDTASVQVDDFDYFFGEILFCIGITGGSGWTDAPVGNSRVVIDITPAAAIGVNGATTGRFRVKTHSGATFTLPDGQEIGDNQVVISGSIFIPDAFGGPDPNNPTGLDCQTEFGAHFNTVFDALWYESDVCQWQDALPVPALSTGGKLLMLAAVGLLGLVLIGRSRKVATA